MTRTTAAGAMAVLSILIAGPAVAQDAAPTRPSLEVLERIIETRTPQTRVEAPDHDRITARRIDIVDADGTIRMTLSGATPAPIIDGIQYKRAFNVAGLILYDDKGSERGGFGTADVEGGMAVLALDHPAMAAFSLHQAVEAAYACFLLVHTFYFPRSHNIKFLRSLAEDVDTRLVEAWPREQRADRRRFELLKRAYVEARYSDQYDASAEDLDWLTTRARMLRDLVANLCQSRIAELKSKAETA